MGPDGEGARPPYRAPSCSIDEATEWTIHVDRTNERSEKLMDVVLEPPYSEQVVENGVSHHMEDMIFASISYNVPPATQKGSCDAIKERVAEYYKKIEASGVKLDFGANETGPQGTRHRRSETGPDDSIWIRS